LTVISLLLLSMPKLYQSVHGDIKSTTAHNVYERNAFPSCRDTRHSCRKVSVIQRPDTNGSDWWQIKLLLHCVNLYWNGQEILSYILLGNEKSLNNTSFGNNGDINFKLPGNAPSPILATKTRDDLYIYIYKHTHTVLHITRKLTYIPISDNVSVKASVSKMNRTRFSIYFFPNLCLTYFTTKSKCNLTYMENSKATVCRTSKDFFCLFYVNQLLY